MTTQERLKDLKQTIQDNHKDNLPIECAVGLEDVDFLITSLESALEKLSVAEEALKEAEDMYQTNCAFVRMNPRKDNVFSEAISKIRGEK